MKLDENLYVYEWTDFMENNCNSYYIGGPGILIDPGLKKFFPDLLERMGEDGIGEEEIRYVLNTHSHPDHFEASVLFNGNGQVKTGLSPEERTFHEASGKLLYSWFGLDLPEVDIDLDLPEGPLVLDGESFQVLLTPGHSPVMSVSTGPGEKPFSAETSFSTRTWAGPISPEETASTSSEASSAFHSWMWSTSSRGTWISSRARNGSGRTSARSSSSFSRTFDDPRKENAKAFDGWEKKGYGALL